MEMNKFQLKEDIENCCNSIHSLVNVYKEINKLMSDGKYEDINDLFMIINVENVCDTMLVGLLRLTFYRKFYIKYWRSLFEKIRDELIKRGCDSEKTLQGLS